jgi:uncharacterized repeat protein (TIGR03917 family)
MSEPTVQGPDEPAATPAEDEQVPAVALMPWGTDEWALVVQAGSDSADLYRALARMPAGLKFSEAHGDVDVILVYRVPDHGPTRRGCAGAALRAALTGTTGAGNDGARWMTDGEREAYRAGKADALDSLHWKVADAVGPTRRPPG